MLTRLNKICWSSNPRFPLRLIATTTISCESISDFRNNNNNNNDNNNSNNNNRKHMKKPRRQNPEMKQRDRYNSNDHLNYRSMVKNMITELDNPKRMNDREDNISNDEKDKDNHHNSIKSERKFKDLNTGVDPERQRDASKHNNRNIYNTNDIYQRTPKDNVQSRVWSDKRNVDDKERHYDMDDNLKESYKIDDDYVFHDDFDYDDDYDNEDGYDDNYIDDRHKKSRKPIGEQKVLNIAVIGQPNVGKSTLINHLVGERVSTVTSIPHTTRRMVRGIVNVDDTQLVLMDTPGSVTIQEARRLKMHKDHIRTPGRTTGSADLVAVVVDVWNKYTKKIIPDDVLAILQQHSHIPSVLVMNKVDKVPKHDLIDLAEILNSPKAADHLGIQQGGWQHFDETHFISAKRGQGITILMNYFLSCARPATWEFPEDVYSDATHETAIAEVIREKLLTMVGEELPWQVKQETVSCVGNEDEGAVRIVQQLWWPRTSQRRYMLTKETELVEACADVLKEIFRCEKVDLKLIISHKANMTKDDVHYT